jgi:uncharacterized protein
MAQETLHDGVQLTFYCHRHAKHEGVLLSEWLLELAKRQGIGGGSIFRAVAGFGRHGVLHAEQFFDLADDLPLKVEFLLRTDQAEALLAGARAAGVDAVYAKVPASFAVLGAN